MSTSRCFRYISSHGNLWLSSSVMALPSFSLTLERIQRHTYVSLSSILSLATYCRLQIYPAELFPTRYRAFAHGISAASGKAGAIISASAFSTLSNKVGIPAILWSEFPMLDCPSWCRLIMALSNEQSSLAAALPGLCSVCCFLKCVDAIQILFSLKRWRRTMCEHHRHGKTRTQHECTSVVTCYLVAR